MASDHPEPRHERRRRRLGRPRRGAALVCLLLAAGAAGAVLLGLGSGHGRHARRAAAARPTERVARARRYAGARVRLARRETGEVDRLVALTRPLYCGGDRGRYAALTFDDGPGFYTHLALRILRRAGARGTFFLVGRNLARFPGFVRPELALGAVGDHTWTHPYLPALTHAAMVEELARTQRAIAQRTGIPVRLFRPPYGAHDPTIDAEARRLGLLEVLWSLDSRDSEGANWQQIAKNVVSAIRPGAIVLMHENRGQTIRALKLVLLPKLRALHWRLVSVPELLALDPPSRRLLAEGAQGCVGAGRVHLSGGA